MAFSILFEKKFYVSSLDIFGRHISVIFIKTDFSIRLGFNHRSVNEFWWFFSGASGQNSTAGWWSSKTTRNRYLSPTAENTASTAWSILFLKSWASLAWTLHCGKTSREKSNASRSWANTFTMKIYTNQKNQFENGETFRRLSRDSEVLFLVIDLKFKIAIKIISTGWKTFKLIRISAVGFSFIKIIFYWVCVKNFINWNNFSYDTLRHSIETLFMEYIIFNSPK